MLSTAARTIKTNTLKRAVSPLTTSIRTKVTLPSLPYAYNALEPYISEEIMTLHHTKHHQTYVNAFNQAEEKLQTAFQANDLTQQLALQNALKFNGGGHINHSLFWKNLAPKDQGGGKLPKGALSSAIEKEFGSFDNFIKEFNAAAAGVQGSGWAWLGYNKAANRLELATTPNQDPLLHLVPLLGIDVWEHAYYLQYKNVRPDYLKAVWEVVNWETVAERFAKAK
ncbi:manganese and iron superoxide dismutase [Rhizopus microsporus var. microsporus]|uniref:Superoxide dismutase n=2 Tax=Rhizopus microsporus TaxID=58291 RepID=A0A2G4T836_RHIZD|nr:mitochondrial manganese superoxide dismutase [Rhizopus microsporus ATCC 52813]ORE09243.1 manganese and iron superoxide dismutase [Rhizopus microsporus var. microsporus]PHZ17178.1 mitochondrial manganese superoxide dismutase [Rhizopus microsporus ATCC 52813]